MSNATPETLLALLAVTLLGGKDVPKSAETIKALKKLIEGAINNGYLAEGKASVLNDKGKQAKVAVISLTPQGENFLRQSSSPEAAVARVQSQASELRQALEADRASLREQVLAAVKPGKGGKDKVVAEVAALAKAISGINERLTRLEAAVTSSSDDAVLAKIDDAFEALTARLNSKLSSRAAEGTRPAPSPAAHSLRDVLHAAYDRLTRFVEYQDGIVDLPRLYHEARKARPDLTPAGMHAELNALSAERVVELNILNEVHQAAEPELGIWHNDKLLYYVFWKRP